MAWATWLVGWLAPTLLGAAPFAEAIDGPVHEVMLQPRSAAYLRYTDRSTQVTPRYAANKRTSWDGIAARLWYAPGP